MFFACGKQIGLFMSFVAFTAACGPSESEGVDWRTALHDDPAVLEQPLWGVAPDPLNGGSRSVVMAEYRLPPEVDSDVLAGRETEIWAALYRPERLEDGEHPVVVLLHGNHGTCGFGSNPRRDESTAYTLSGKCPDGWVVVPNHLGFGYLAERLASFGFIVVSINANRGITGGDGDKEDWGLNLARGRLILKHLSLLSAWNAVPQSTPASLGVELAGKLDLSRVGLAGHSRGGEGARAAYELYQDASSPWPARMKSPLGLKAVFELAPVDGQANRVLNVLGAAWGVLLPLCDGDVIGADGMKPFDRMLVVQSEEVPRPKSTFAVWGANHNFYNTEWQKSDALRCRGINHVPLFETDAITSEKQKETGAFAVTAFFRAHLGEPADETYARLFDPEYSVPERLAQLSRFERSFTVGSSAKAVRMLESFDAPAPSTEVSNVEVSFSTVPGHDTSVRSALIRWRRAGAESWFQSNWAPQGSSVDLSGMTTLEFRVSRKDVRTNVEGPTNFSIQLVGAHGTLSQRVALEEALNLAGITDYWTLETVRLRLDRFTGVDLRSVRGMRLTFDDSAKGALYLTHILATNQPAPHGKGAPRRLARTHAQAESETGPKLHTERTQVVALRPAPPAGDVTVTSDLLELELRSETPFTPGGELLVLHVGALESRWSRYPKDGDTRRLIFRIPRAAWERVPDGTPVAVRRGEAEVWKFGALRKQKLGTCRIAAQSKTCDET